MTHGQPERLEGTRRLSLQAALLIFAVALAVRLIHLWYMNASPFATVLLGDARAYDTWARELAAGNWVGREVFYQAPLYPYLLGAVYAVVGHDLGIARGVQALIGAGACVMIAAAGARLFGLRIGLAAGLILAFYAPAIFLGALLQKSVVDLFLVCSTLYLVAELIDRRRSNAHWFALGVSVGALSLTRENALVLTLVLFAWALTSVRTLHARLRIAWRAPAAYALGVALLLVPVAARNMAVGGGFYLTTSQFGPNFYIGNNPAATGSYRGLREGREDPTFERADATELAQANTGRTLSPSEVSRFWRARAWAYITSEPLEWLTLLGRKARLLVSATEMIDTEAQESHADYSPLLRLLARFGHFGVLLPLAALGVLATWPQRARLRIVYILAIAYAATLLVFYVVARYRYPLIPFAVLFAAAGAAALPSLIRSASRQRQAVAAAMVTILAALTMWPVLDADVMRAVTETNLGAALQAQGRLADAAHHYERATVIRPDYFPAHNNLGVVRRAEGNLDQAVAAYRRVLQIRPNDPNAQHNLATALLEQGNAREAARYFAASRGAVVDSAAAHNNFGVSLLASGRVEEAIAEFRAALALEPQSVIALRNVGDALARARRYPESVDHLRRRAALAPNDPAAHYDLGNVLLEARQPAAAADAFRLALALAPASAQAHNRLAIALAAQGQMEAAIAHFREAIRLQPDFEEARRYLSIALEGRQ